MRRRTVRNTVSSPPRRGLLNNYHRLDYIVGTIFFVYAQIFHNIFTPEKKKIYVFFPKYELWNGIYIYSSFMINLKSSYHKKKIIMKFKY